jgi:hypothetical protein
VALEQVTAPGAAVGPADDDVGVQLRLLAVERDHPQEREDLDLLGQGDPAILLGGRVEIAEDDVAQGADGRHVARTQPLARREPRQLLDHLVVLVEDDHERALSAVQEQG